MLGFGPFCLDLGHIAWILAIWQNLGQNRPQRRRSLEDRAGGRTYGCTDRFPLSSTGLCPLRGRCPKGRKKEGVEGRKAVWKERKKAAWKERRKEERKEGRKKERREGRKGRNGETGGKEGMEKREEGSKEGKGEGRKWS